MKTQVHTRITLLSVSVLLAALPPSDVPAQGLPDLPFTSASSGADGPLNFPTPLENYNQTVFDSARNQLVTLANGNSTWVWDGRDWKKLSPATSPPLRDEYQMAYDEVRQQVVLFGGRGGVGGTVRLGDTWVW